MANIVDYIHWRGDLTFRQSPFCEADNLILSYLAYVNIDGIDAVTGKNSATVEELSRRFFEMHTEEELKEDKSFIRLVPYMMKAMAESDRFRGAVVRNYVNETVTEAEQQFSALEVMLEDKTSYIAFRGTDDTIVGWKEDFNLSNGIVPAQEAAVRYINTIAGFGRRKIRTGGHSKGGNLAVYAAAKCSPRIKRRIIEIYDNDGPGFTADFLADRDLLAVVPKIKRFIPEYSVIGMLLGHVVEPVIVSSSQKGIFQHDGLSWEVMGPRFVYKEKLSKKAESFNDTLHKWIDGMDNSQRDILIHDLFSVLEATGVRTLTEVQSGGLKSVRAMLRQIESLNPSSRGMVEELLKSLFSLWLEELKQPVNKIFKKEETKK